MAEKKARFSFTIFHKILLAMLIVALVPLSGVWYVSHQTAVEGWTTTVHQRLSGVAETLGSEVDGWVDMNLRVMQQNAALDDMISMDAARQNSILKTISDTYDWNYLVFTIRPDGQNIGRNDGKSTRYYGDRQYFREVIDGKPVSQQVVIGKTSGKPALILAAPIKASGRKIAGVIAMAMTLTKISEAVTNAKIATTGFAFLLDESGKVIAHPKQDLSQTRQDMSAHPAFQGVLGPNDRQVVYEEDGKKIVAYAQQTKRGWTLIAQQDYAEAFALVRKVDRNALVLLGITVIFVSIMTFVVSRRLANPIRNLTTIADEISRGKLGEAIAETKRGDEIGALARAIERMGVSIQLAMERLKKRA